MGERVGTISTGLQIGCKSMLMAETTRDANQVFNVRSISRRARVMRAKGWGWPSRFQNPPRARPAKSFASPIIRWC
jgi:hypothetical protein